MFTTDTGHSLAAREGKLGERAHVGHGGPSLGCVSRCRRLRCQTNSRKTGAVVSAEPSGSVKSVQREWAVAGSSPAAHLLCGVAAGSPACNTITAPAIVGAELRAQSIIG